MGAVQFAAVVMFVMGAGALVIGVQAGRQELARRRHGVRVIGVVLGSQFGTTVARSTSGPSGHFYPVVEFTADGRRRQFTDSVGTNVRPRAGRQVVVWFDPSDPDAEPVIMSTARRFLLPAVFGLVGVAGVGTGVVLGALTLAGALD